MRVSKREFFSDLRKPKPSSKEPVAKSVGVYDMALMIARKTKFRVWDVKEVLEEVGPVIYALLLQRKTVDFGGINIRSKWNRVDWPRYVQDEGIWQFGYFKPAIDFEKPYHMLYYGVDTVVPKGFVESITPYMSNGEQTLEDLINTSNEVAKETAQLGKDFIVGEDGIVIPPKGCKKKRPKRFREDFHPDVLEVRRYMQKRKYVIFDYLKGKKEGIYPNEEYPGMNTYIRKRMIDAGFANWYSGYDDEPEDEEDILEPEESEDA